MKVVLFNGSPRKEGNTYQALEVVAKELEDRGVDTEILQVGTHVIRGCTACNACAKNRNEKCIFNDDPVNEYLQVIKEADGLVLGSPVHYASISGTMKSFLDRLFYVASNNGGLFRHKVGAGLVAVRRSGGLTAFDQLNHYLTYSEMMMPTAQYWNVIHGTRPGDIHQDEEGLQILRTLGRNMAGLIKMKEEYAGDLPDKERKVFTHFVR